MNTARIVKRENLQAKPTDETKLGFGKIFTDYMLQADYTPEQGWHDYRIVPYEAFDMLPANPGLHYGQLIFEGMKAYKNDNGQVLMFRPMENMLRLNRSAERICIPQMDPEVTLAAISQLVAMEKDWIPTGPECSLYVRPFIFSTGNFLSAKVADTYTFLTILSPVGSYYANGLAPTKLLVEDEYVRAVPGGCGEAKCAGNYATSLIAQKKAQSLGCDQVLWLDGVHREYVEEAGTSNVFFVLEDEVVTPALNGSILPGITRKSTVELIKSWGLTMNERQISIEEVAKAHAEGKLKEVFATGTAAVISPVGQLKYKDKIMEINNSQIGEISMRVYDGIVGIQKGKVEDKFNWVYVVE